MSTASSLISPKELKELRRVFDTLCHYADRHPRPLKPASAGEQTPQIPAFARSRGHDDDDDGEYTVQSTNTTGLSLMSNMSSLRLLEPHTDCIRAQDIAAALRDLGTRTSKQEVQEMLCAEGNAAGSESHRQYAQSTKFSLSRTTNVFSPRSSTTDLVSHRCQ